MALDILVVIMGVVFGGKFGICTIITVIISGPIIQFVNAKAKQVFKICQQRKRQFPVCPIENSERKNARDFRPGMNAIST